MRWWNSARKADRKLDEERAAERREMRALLQTMAAAAKEQAAVMREFLANFRTDGPPEVRKNGDEITMDALRDRRLEALGFPATGTEREKLEWLSRHADTMSLID